MAASVVIRPMTESDFDGFYACLDAVARERKYLSFIEAPSVESSRAWLQQSLGRGNPHVVAVAGSHIVGWCDISPHTLAGLDHAGQLGMGVRADFRRRGIGERLIRAAIARAREIGLERIEFNVFASNTAARALYTKVGFAVEGTKRRARKIDGHYDDIVAMAMLLVDADSQ